MTALRLDSPGDIQPNRSQQYFCRIEASGQMILQSLTEIRDGMELKEAQKSVRFSERFSL